MELEMTTQRSQALMHAFHLIGSSYYFLLPICRLKMLLVWGRCHVHVRLAWFTQFTHIDMIRSQSNHFIFLTHNHRQENFQPERLVQEHLGEKFNLVCYHLDTWRSHHRIQLKLNTIMSKPIQLPSLALCFLTHKSCQFMNYGCFTFSWQKIMFMLWTGATIIYHEKVWLHKIRDDCWYGMFRVKKLRKSKFSPVTCS